MDTDVHTETSHLLIEKCKNGDRKAQYELYHQYARAMFNLSMRITNDYTDSEDALQESFLSAFRHLHHYKGEVTFGAWLKQIVINKSLSALKKRRMNLLFDSLEVPEDHGNEVKEEETQWQVEQLRNAIQKLPDGYRIVLSLYLLEGYDHAEIAGILQISEETSKSQYSRARKRLLQIVKNDSVSV